MMKLLLSWVGGAGGFFVLHLLRRFGVLDLGDGLFYGFGVMCY